MSDSLTSLSPLDFFAVFSVWCVVGFFLCSSTTRQEDGSSFEEGMLKLLRTLPKVLKYLPSDKAKDARNFMMSFQVL